MENDKPSFRDFRLWFLLHNATNALCKARGKELSQYGISVIHSAVLYLMSDFGGKATVADIARGMSKQPTEISRQLKTLEELGLVKKTEPEGNQRSRIFSLTQEGEKTYKETIKCESIHEAMSLLSTLDRHALELHLIKVWEKSIKQLR